MLKRFIEVYTDYYRFTYYLLLQQLISDTFFSWKSFVYGTCT